MKRLFFLFHAMAVSLLFGVSSHAADLVLDRAAARVCFTPGGECLSAVAGEIAKARSEVLVQAFSFNSPSVVKALLEAHRRGVTVRVLLDASEREEGYTSASHLTTAGISVLYDGRHAVANNRVMVIDRRVVMTGSLSLNRPSDEMNAENLLVLVSPELARLYRENWERHWAHSETY